MDRVRESPRVFADRKHLMGILAEPGQRPTRGPAVVILNAGIIHRVGPSRVGVSLARALADEGFRTFRFDLSGIGDSTLATEEGGTLREAVVRDIQSAIDLVCSRPGQDEEGVVLFGICSGADNSFFVGGADPRVRGLVLVDPTVHPTAGFHLRKALERLRSPRSWWNLVSGKSLLARLRKRSAGVAAPPPDHYGLLTMDPEEVRLRARQMAERKVRFLYVITGGIRGECNYPEQILDSAFAGAPGADVSIEWRPEADHLLTRGDERAWLEKRVLRFAEGFPAGAEPRTAPEERGNHRSPAEAGAEADRTSATSMRIR